MGLRAIAVSGGQYTTGGSLRKSIPHFKGERPVQKNTGESVGIAGEILQKWASVLVALGAVAAQGIHPVLLN